MSLLDVVRRTYRRLARQDEDDQFREVAGALSEAPVFEGMPRRALRTLAEAVHARTFRREEFLYYEGDPGLGLYVVRSGRVRLMAEDDAGELHELGQAGPGAAFGDLALLGDFPRMETARAVVETQVLGFFRPDLKTMRKRHPKAAAAVVEALARHLAQRQVTLSRLVAEDGGALRAKRLLERAGQWTGAEDSRRGLPPEE